MAVTAVPLAEQPTRSSVVLFAALLGASIIGLDASVVNVALPRIGGEFGGSTAGLQWIVDAYTLMFAACLLSAGALGDRFGAERLYRGGMAAFALASLGCGLAPGLDVLIIARLAQGVAAAVVLPSSLAILRHAYPDATERARAISIWAVGGSSLIAAGPVVGGALTQTVGWRWIFFVNVPIGVLALIAGRRAVPAPRRPAALDWPGQVTAVVALGSLTLAVIEAGDGGPARPVVLGSGLLAIIAGTAFVVIERRAAQPVLPLALFRSRLVSGHLALGFVLNVVFYGVMFLLSLYGQQVLHLSPLRVGLMFLPATALIVAANLLAPRMAERWSVRTPLLVGQLLCLAGMAGLLVIDSSTRPATIAALLVPLAAGAGLVAPSLITALLRELDADRAGLAAGTLNAVRQTGGTLAIAVFGALASRSVLSGLHASLAIAIVLMVLTAADTIVTAVRARRYRRWRSVAPTERATL